MPVLFTHCSVNPVIVPGVTGATGLTVTANVCNALVPQELVADTVILPLAAAPEVAIVIALVLLPDVIDQPEGTVQL